MSVQFTDLDSLFEINSNQKEFFLKKIIPIIGMVSLDYIKINGLKSNTVHKST